MDTLKYKTKSASKETVDRKWFIIDAEDLVVGRLASRIANIVRGKHKASFTPHVNCGDHVVVINCEKVRFTGKKMYDKEYIRHTGYPGGRRSLTAQELLDKKPEEIVRKAVNGMLPKNKLQKQFMKNLHVFAGTEHPHQAQKPEKLEL